MGGVSSQGCGWLRAEQCVAMLVGRILGLRSPLLVVVTLSHVVLLAGSCLCSEGSLWGLVEVLADDVETLACFGNAVYVEGIFLLSANQTATRDSTLVEGKA